MKTKKIYILAFIMISCWIGNAQNSSKNKISVSNGRLNLPKEQIYVHSSSQNIFAGENFYYKVYVRNSENNLLSNFSKVAYVSLIGQKNALVFTQKIRLTKGEGYGDYLIPPEIPTGNYKLIAYTKMGINQQKNNAFVTDISIINPYTALNLDLVSVTEEPTASFNTTVAGGDLPKIQIYLDDTIYSKRKKVELELNTSQISDYGNYSISVKKIDPFISTQANILKFNNYQKKVDVEKGTNLIPELRGELITGKLKSSNDKASLKHQHIAFSIPEENFIFKIGITDTDGRFLINVDKPYLSNTGFLRVLNEFNEDYEFEVDEEPVINKSTLTFEKLTINKNLKDYILERSIKNQIENSYSSAKQNIPKISDKSFFFGNRAVKYHLDDFTRFPTLNETFVEIVKNTWFKKKNDGYEIKISAIDDFLRSPYEALVIIDGLYIKDHSNLYNYSAFNIQNISVIRDKYYYGGKVFQGVLYIETKEKNYLSETQTNDFTPAELFKPEQEKSYYKADYSQDNDKLENIPDFRTQLYWNPMLLIRESNTSIDFFTSDEAGTFEVVLEGINKKGESIRAITYFKVQ
jgi:hypothetical protein